jgi:hypothetical protein
MAEEQRQQLRAGGIQARVVVDPLSCRYPALSDCHEVAVLVQDQEETAATQLLRGRAPLRRAS